MTAKQPWYPCSGPPMDSTNYRKSISNFLSSWLANRQWYLQQVNHGTRVLKSWYTGRGPEDGFWHCFTDGLDQSLVLSAAQASSELTWSITGLDVLAMFACYCRHEVSHYCVFLFCGNFCYLPCIPNHVVIKKFCL